MTGVRPMSGSDQETGNTTHPTQYSVCCIVWHVYWQCACSIQDKHEHHSAVQAAPAADGDDEAKPAPKAKNPLDALPPSSMMLDGWKRLYSNTPAAQFRGVAIKGLWEGADIPRSLSNEVGL